LSTAQQVWLQKLGGANISASTFAEDIIKKDEFQIPKPVAELGSTKNKAREGEKLTSEGLRPGER
jgi:YidC/Oxa1 family membrane protein insertase